MAAMNRGLNLPSIQRIMNEFERESSAMDMKEEMMTDAVDDVMNDEEEDEEEEGDKILKEVLDEIGVGLQQQVSPMHSQETQAIVKSPNVSSAKLPQQILPLRSVIRNKPSRLERAKVPPLVKFAEPTQQLPLVVCLTKMRSKLGSTRYGSHERAGSLIPVVKQCFALLACSLSIQHRNCCRIHRCRHPPCTTVSYFCSKRNNQDLTMSRFNNVEICCRRRNFSLASPNAVWEVKYAITDLMSRSSLMAPS